MTNSIIAEGLTKRYDTVTAVDGIGLAVKEGTVFGLLGPNGAGKTTTVSILATLVRPDAGHAQVAGYDVTTQAHQVRQAHTRHRHGPQPGRVSRSPRPNCA